jgi:subtilisin family serine protease
MSIRTRQWSAILFAVGAAFIAGCGDTPDTPVIEEEVVTPAGNPVSVVADELIVTATPGADEADLEELFAESGATIRERLTELSAYLLGVDPAQRDQAQDALDDSPLIEEVADNNVLDVDTDPDDSADAFTWHLDAIQAPTAWKTTTGSPSVIVAVLDTGVDTDHPALAAQLRSGGNTVDGVSGWRDQTGHGTAVAGIIAANDESQDIPISVARTVSIMPIRVVDDTSWAIASAIGLALSNGARVINVSIAPLHDDVIVLRQAALARLAGALVVIAAGNSGERIDAGGSDAALFVGATDQDDALAEISSFGDFVDLVAPGADIYSTDLDGGYSNWTGSSFATPIVSGTAALVWSVNPELRATTVRGLLLATADDLGPAGDDVRFGAGRVNALAAVELALGIEEHLDDVPPTVSIVQPAQDAFVSGNVVVQARVTDDGDIADVTLSVDGAALATDTISPYAFIVNAGDYAVGTHTISVVATDFFGNAAEASIRLDFADGSDAAAPTVSITGPTQGSVLRGLVTILAEAADDRLLTRAEILIDATLIGTLNLATAQATIAYNWDASGPDATPGSHTLTVRVFDAAGNTASADVSITVGD